MKASTIAITLLSALFLYSCNNVPSQKSASDLRAETTRYKMFCAAIANLSTAPNYVVIIVKNLNTGKKMEFCTEAPFLIGAVTRETGAKTYELDCKKYKDRYFEFSNDSALWNISFGFYSKAELDAYAETINIPDIVKQIQIGKLTNKTFTDGGKEQILFAHLMFNNGVMIRNDCEAGNVVHLSYFKE